MKFSESWLREWVNPPITTSELVHQLTMAGLEVSDVVPVAGTFTGVKVGHVVDCNRIRGSERLYLTKVDIGKSELLNIVCGAPNCRKNLRVAVAMVGATVSSNEVESKKLFGQLSQGMLCSFYELGIDVKSEGIIELAADVPVGHDFHELWKLDDFTVNIDLTSNRADCFSIKGLAREVAVLNRMGTTFPETTPVKVSIKDILPVEVLVPRSCPRYLCRIIKNVAVDTATPLWIQENLRRCGIRPVNLVVDITNYVLLEQGQPMHVFDLDKIRGGINIRQAKEGERLTLLEGNEIFLSPDVLVASDQEQVLTLAGIVGGNYSSLNKDTKNILMECAFFEPSAIRGRAHRYGLHTESSIRYERGVDSTLQKEAIERATQLITDIVGGDVGPVLIVESASNLPKVHAVLLRRAKLAAVLGYSIPDTEVVEILEGLGIRVESTTEGWKTLTPAWRFDISIEQDLIEEVGRVYGYDNIPPKTLSYTLTAAKSFRKEQPNSLMEQVRHSLVYRGYHEVLTYSFVEPKQQKLFFPDSEPILLSNPISLEMSAMRLGLVQGILNTVSFNQNRQQSRLRLFECGPCFIPDQMAENGIRQDHILAGVISGTRLEEHWDVAPNHVDFFDLKGDLESIFERAGSHLNIEFRATQHPALHPGQGATISFNDQPVGFIGTSHPKIERALGLNGRSIMFEINWSAVSRRFTHQDQEIMLPSKYPFNRRDIALIVDQNVVSSDVVSACLSSSNRLLTNARLFDVYAGEGIEKGKKSLAISLTIESKDGTLGESDIADAIESVIKIMREKFNATLRQ